MTEQSSAPVSGAFCPQPFRTDIGYNIFQQKYSHDGTMDWATLAWTLVTEVCGYSDKDKRTLLSQDDQYELFTIIRDMKFIPGGRYLYYAGRPLSAYNNCGVASTKLLTDKGWVTFGEVAGTEVSLLSPVDGKYKKATVYSHGVQDVYEYTFSPVRGKSTIEYRVQFTEDHKWLLKNGTTTEMLSVGDVVPASAISLDRDDVGFAHGFVFGDGNNNGQLRLCGSKDVSYLPRLSKVTDSVTYPAFSKGDPCLYFKQGKDKWKSLPEEGASPEYIASFIMGWIAADGSGDRLLCSVNKEALEWFREHAAYAGLVVTGELRYQDRDITIGEYEYPNHRIYMQSWCRGEAWQGFKVTSKRFVGAREVFCPFEPEFNQIVIDHGIRTYQCYLLRGEEDTREEWGNLLKRSSDCLMSGGGIGVDYSVFRPEGAALSRTGGKASGPIPLMHSVNEAGRNVMQGGSRRSAIYASLDWNHGDAEAFLTMKNWDAMPIGKVRKEDGSPYTVWDAKQDNIDYPAPLDMTNVSLNYNDAWLGSEHRESNPTFHLNCRQAMRTGEPGFSFNFGSKQRETLRNACCEVVSEDDSDVCNLGSVNLSRIHDIEELKRVVELGSMFLVCGTLRADLPYDKVYAVREKNRRLGLGLMGVHEWLLCRGHGYEVTDEFRSWLSVYRSASERAADALCDKLNISRPVAYRAIAPTGTIGMIAGTTTGIEPLFAVAYKRRYLKGKKWHYQYTIDGTADLLINTYGLDPTSIDTAYGMANNFEQRIKFQADVQDYVDMAISSTINLPAWGSSYNNEDRVADFAATLSKYAPRLRGFTAYPDGSRGGQPLTLVDYSDAVLHRGVVYEENDSCSGGVCGL